MEPTNYCYDFIARYEGCPTEVFNGERRAVPYIDVTGHPTIGYGRLLTWDQYRYYKSVNGITLEGARRFLIEDVDRFSRGVQKLVKVPLKDYQLDSLISFSYNVGLANFKKSTLLKKLNSKDYNGAANEFTRWVYSKGKKLPGLVSRREAEKRMFINNPPRDYNPSLADAYFKLLTEE